MRPPDLPVIRIKNLHFKNPFAILARPTPLTNPNGRVTPDLLMYYKKLTRSEAALVITGPATVTPPGSRKHSLLRVDQPKYLDGLRALCKIIHANGGIPGIQIVHPGPFEANEILAGVTEMRADPADYPEKKLLNAYHNAAVRSIEVGYRYVEISAGGRLLLHQLVEEGRQTLVRDIFDRVIDGVGAEGITALRLDPGFTRTHEIGRIFLEMGGDLVCLDTEVEAADQLDGRLMLTLDGIVSGAEARSMHEHTRLIGMDPTLTDKRSQISSWFRGH